MPINSTYCMSIACQPIRQSVNPRHPEANTAHIRPLQSRSMQKLRRLQLQPLTLSIAIQHRSFSVIILISLRNLGPITGGLNIEVLLWLSHEKDLASKRLTVVKLLVRLLNCATFSVRLFVSFLHDETHNICI